MVRRAFIYGAGVLILALGLVLNAKTGLGVSPILSVPYAISHTNSISFGMWTAIVYAIMVLIQLVLKRGADLRVLLQLPFSYLFGVLIDVYNHFIVIEHPSLLLSLFLLALAIVLTALGVVLMVRCDLITNPADGFVNTIALKTRTAFGRVKLCLDLSMVCLTLLISFVLIHHLEGIGIGTLIAAFTTGPCIAFVQKHLKILQVKVERTSV